MLLTDGKVLLVRHRYGGRLMFPGGGVEPGETAWAAARRELLEETGIADCGPLRLAGAYLNLADGRPDYVLLFKGGLPHTVAPYEPALLSEVESIHIEDANAEDDRFSPATRRRIAEIVNGAPVSEWWLKPSTMLKNTKFVIARRPKADAAIQDNVGFLAVSLDRHGRFAASR